VCITRRGAYFAQTRHWCQWVQSLLPLETKRMMATVTAVTVKHQQKSPNRHDPSHDNDTVYVQLTSTHVTRKSQKTFNTTQYYYYYFQFLFNWPIFTQSRLCQVHQKLSRSYSGMCTRPFSSRSRRDRDFEARDRGVDNSSRGETETKAFRALDRDEGEAYQLQDTTAPRD